MPEGKGRDDGKRTGIIKSFAEQQAEFTTAEGFEVNLFASEEQFPELRNPVQIAFDRVRAAAAKNGKTMGTAVGPGESMRRVAEKGGRWFNCSHELGALTNGYRDALQATDAITKGSNA